MSRQPSGVRFAEVERETDEVRVQVTLDMDGGTRQDISTGVAFLDRLLALFAHHAGIDIGIKTEGERSLDDHIIAREVGFALGKAIREALRESEPMMMLCDCCPTVDDALVQVSLNLGGTGYCGVELDIRREMIGDFATENIALCLRSLCASSKMSLHVVQLKGENSFHLCEASFIGLGKCLRGAAEINDRNNSKSKL